MVELKEQVGNNGGQINDREEIIRVCKDLKEQNRKIVNYIEEKIKIWNCTGNNMNMNDRKIEKGTLKFDSSKTEHPKVFVQELQIYLDVIKKQIGNQYDQARENAIITED
ncbi:hypothetical protein FQA39_LY02972 [Lamprigera yunnana]|nr:hypothetical protein FQA39_LY02972 [Lamprigera yunnana]